LQQQTEAQNEGPRRNRRPEMKNHGNLPLMCW
jgi:hypothetical protein